MAENALEMRPKPVIDLHRDSSLRHPHAPRPPSGSLSALVPSCLAPFTSAAPALAFPDAKGFGASTPGGRGGKIIRVTTLAPKGAGSLKEALQTKGPRVIVFEVGGVIDLAGETLTAKEPFLTIAGQTAPSPGITLIKGTLSIQTHDVDRAAPAHSTRRGGPCQEERLGGGWAGRHRGLERDLRPLLLHVGRR